MMRCRNNYCSIVLLVTLATAAPACSSSSPNNPDSTIPDLDPGLNLISNVYESLVRVSHELVEGTTYRDTWEVSEAGIQKLANGSSLDFVVSVFMEVSNSSFRIQIPGTEDWISLFDFDSSLPWTMAGGATYFWSVWDREGAPPIIDALSNAQLTIEWSNAHPRTIRIVDVRSDMLGPVLPMNVVYCASAIERDVIQVRSPNRLNTYENGTLHASHRGGSIQPFTVANGHAWWLNTDPEDVLSLHWVDLATGETNQRSGFPYPMSGVAGLDTLLIIGTELDTTWLNGNLHCFSIPQILSGSSLASALIDSLNPEMGIRIWGSLPLSHRIYGITDEDMSGGLKELQIGMWDTVSAGIIKSTVPFPWDGLLGLIETQSGLFIGAKRIHKQAIGWDGEELTLMNFISTEPRLYRYPIQQQPEHFR